MFFSGDPAIVQLGDDATDDQRTDRVRQIDHARETGDWSAVVVGGLSPSKFTFRPLPGDVFALIQDMLSAGVGGGGIGFNAALFLIFRLALVSVSDLGDAVVRIVVDDTFPRLGPMADAAIVNKLNSWNPALVPELGVELLKRARGPSPKS